MKTCPPHTSGVVNSGNKGVKMGFTCFVYEAAASPVNTPAGGFSFCCGGAP